MTENEQTLAIVVAGALLPGCIKRTTSTLAGHPLSVTQMDQAIDQSFDMAERFIERVMDRYPDGIAQIRNGGK